MYRNILYRKPEVGGFNHHLSAYNSGVSLAKIQQDFRNAAAQFGVTDIASAKRSITDSFIGQGGSSAGAAAAVARFFANGATFTNGIVSQPTNFNIGQMGEAGPEAIMPLSRMSDGSLGVAYSGQSDNSELVAELRALRAQVERLEQHAAANVRITQAVGKAQIETLEVIADASTDSAKSQRLMELAR